MLLVVDSDEDANDALKQAGQIEMGTAAGEKRKALKTEALELARGAKCLCQNNL